MKLKLLLNANGSIIKSVTVNGKIGKWRHVEDAVGHPLIEIEADIQPHYTIKVVWQGKITAAVGLRDYYINDEKLDYKFSGSNSSFYRGSAKQFAIRGN
jgi:hypothetical protein